MYETIKDQVLKCVMHMTHIYTCLLKNLVNDVYSALDCTENIINFLHNFNVYRYYLC